MVRTTTLILDVEVEAEEKDECIKKRSERNAGHGN